MKHLFSALTLLALASLACTLGAPTPVTPQVAPTSTAAETPNADNSSAVLLFTIGMHIEPFGATVSTLVPNAVVPPNGNQKPDYNIQKFFENSVNDIQTVTQMVEAHGGYMTIQAQTPFTTEAIKTGNTVLADLASRGNEIALHFHEDAHLGRNSTSLSVETWCAVMKEEVGFIKQASGVNNIRYWSGGNLYPNIYDVAECARLNVNSDWKNPNTQSTDLSIVGVNPWRPAGGTNGTDFTLFAQNDPNGAIVFLPEGQFDKTDFASMRRSDNAGGDAAYFEYLKQSLYASLSAAQAGKVNVFHFTVHPGEFRGDPQHPFQVIEKFLTEVVDPLVASGQVKWATFSEMANAYAAQK